MSYDNLELEIHDGIAFVTIDRPKALNALNDATLTEMEAVFDHCRDDESVRAVVLTGAGDKAFVAGADINELAKMDPLGAKRLAKRGQTVLARLENMGKPTRSPWSTASPSAAAWSWRSPARCARPAPARRSGCPRSSSASSPATAGRSACCASPVRAWPASGS